eukprot:TRINITY_DN6698_c0_g1_i1.p1 TRINITY_DN6698_c0_g1~~TRINITY_DN6698_c0_g1_i1.p1  ORF type:complete len:182 (-),score=33.19 TRINITY_DN6698_c0_g1_i1:36-500(-)
MKIDAVSGGFRVVTTNRIWYLKAENSYEMNRWIDAIQKLTKAEVKSDNFQLEAPTFSGAIEKIDDKKKTAKTKYGMVKDGILYIGKSKGDSKPTKLVLYGCEVSPIDGNGLCTSFRLRTQSKTVVLNADTPEKMKQWISTISRQREAIETIVGT